MTTHTTAAARWRRTLARLGVAALAMGGTLGTAATSHAYLVDPGGGGSGPSVLCSYAQRAECSGMGGTAHMEDGECHCLVFEWVPRRVINASDGDVGLVPIDGRGSPTVTTLTREIGQFHRHTVMFHDSGRQTRHDTMFVDDAEDGTIDGEDYVGRVLLGAAGLNGNDLNNGAPGAITQTIDQTYAIERLASTGLILKPALVLSWDYGFATLVEADREAFVDAVTDALATDAYYKLSDYTMQDSMSLPFDTDRRSGDLRGSHCAGYIAEFYRDQGFSLPDVAYPAALRDDVAGILYTQVRAECRAGLTGWGQLGFLFRACGTVANQVVNCFADLGCGNRSNDWEDGVGTGSATSPDNLLPDVFRYSGSTTYDWDGTELSDPGSAGPYVPLTGGTLTTHPGTTDPDTGSTAGNSASPFQRVEAQRLAGGYYTYTDMVL